VPAGREFSGARRRMSSFKFNGESHPVDNTKPLTKGFFYQKLTK